MADSTSADAAARADEASAAAAHAGAPPASFGEAVGALWGELRASLHERMQLFSLETQRTGLTLVQLMLYAVMAAVLIVTAWLALVCGLGAWLVLHGNVHWAVAVALLIVLNLAMAAWLGWSMRSLVHRLGFPATIRQLQSLGQQPPPSS